MRVKTVTQSRSLASKAFLVLFVINQIIVVHLIWKQFLDYVPLTSSVMVVVHNETTTESVIPTTAEKEISTTTESLTSTTTRRYTMVSEEQSKNDSQIYILFFNGCFGLPFWGLGKETLLEDDLKSVNCPHTNCVFTHKPDLIKNIHDFDAVIFNVWYPDSTVPLTRTSRQHYIFAANE